MSEQNKNPEMAAAHDALIATAGAAVKAAEAGQPGVTAEINLTKGEGFLASAEVKNGDTTHELTVTPKLGELAVSTIDGDRRLDTADQVFPEAGTGLHLEADRTSAGGKLEGTTERREITAEDLARMGDMLGNVQKVLAEHETPDE
jgi:hypothetical protein